MAPYTAGKELELSYPCLSSFVYLFVYTDNMLVASFLQWSLILSADFLLPFVLWCLCILYSFWSPAVNDSPALCEPSNKSREMTCLTSLSPFQSNYISFFRGQQMKQNFDFLLQRLICAALRKLNRSRRKSLQNDPSCKDTPPFLLPIAFVNPVLFVRFVLKHTFLFLWLYLVCFVFAIAIRAFFIFYYLFCRWRGLACVLVSGFPFLHFSLLVICLVLSSWLHANELTSLWWRKQAGKLNNTNNTLQNSNNPSKGGLKQFLASFTAIALAVWTLKRGFCGK